MASTNIGFELHAISESKLPTGCCMHSRMQHAGHRGGYPCISSLSVQHSEQENVVPVTVGDLISSVGALKHTWGICIGVCAQFKAVAKLISART